MEAQSITKLALAIDEFEQLEAMEEQFELKRAKRMLRHLELLTSKQNSEGFDACFKLNLKERRRRNIHTQQRSQRVIFSAFISQRFSQRIAPKVWDHSLRNKTVKVTCNFRDVCKLKYTRSKRYNFLLIYFSSVL